MSCVSRRLSIAALLAAVLALSPAPALQARALPVRTDAWTVPARQEPGLWRRLWQVVWNVWGKDMPVIDPNGKH